MALNATVLGTAITASIEASLDAVWIGNPVNAQLASVLGPGIAAAVVAHLISNAVVTVTGVTGTAVGALGGGPGVPITGTGTGTLT